MVLIITMAPRNMIVAGFLADGKSHQLLWSHVAVVVAVTENKALPVVLSLPQNPPQS